MTSSILDPTLWRQGRDKIAWARRFMPVCAAMGEQIAESGSLKGKRVGLVLVLEPKTANLALQLARAGAEVSVMCNAANTRDDTAAALAHEGVTVFARSDASAAEDRGFALELLDRVWIFWLTTALPSPGWPMLSAPNS